MEMGFIKNGVRKKKYIQYSDYQYDNNILEDVHIF